MHVFYNHQMKDFDLNTLEEERSFSSIKRKACDLFGLSLENVIIDCYDETGNMIHDGETGTHIDHIYIRDVGVRRNPHFSLLGQSGSFELGTNFGNELMSIFMTSSFIQNEPNISIPFNDHPIRLFQHASYEYRQLNRNLTHFEHQILGMMRDPYQPEQIHLQEHHFLRSVFQTGGEEESVITQILSESGIPIFDDLDLDVPWFSETVEDAEVDALNTSFLNERVKVALTEEEYEAIEMKKYGDFGDQVCVICSEPFQENENVRITKCKHIIHDTCLKPWLTKESKHCPVCRCELGKGVANLNTTLLDRAQSSRESS